jgi:hypothetical protein
MGWRAELATASEKVAWRAKERDGILKPAGTDAIRGDGSGEEASGRKRAKEKGRIFSSDPFAFWLFLLPG